MTELMRRRRALMSVGGGSFVHGTWEDLFRAVDAGTFATEYSVGETIPLSLGTEGDLDMRIVAFNTDALYDGSGNAKVTLIAQKTLSTWHRYNPAGTSGDFKNGEGACGGWWYSELREYLANDILPLIPQIVAGRISEVRKYNASITTGGQSQTTQSQDKLWIPSAKELKLISTGSGVQYDIFASNADRVVKRQNGTATEYWLRDVYNRLEVKGVQTSGAIRNSNAPTRSTTYICIGFCVS